MMRIQPVFQKIKPHGSASSHCIPGAAQWEQGKEKPRSHMKSVHSCIWPHATDSLKLPTDLDHLRTILSLCKRRGKRFKYKVNFAVGVNSFLLSQCFRSWLWKAIKPLQCRPHTLPPLFQSWCCSAHQTPSWTGRGKATAVRAAGLHPRGEKPNQ